MTDHVSRANWSVAAIGLTATGIILWLAISFWLDARDQKVDAANIIAVNVVEQKLLNVAFNLAQHRSRAISAESGAAIRAAADQLSEALQHVEQLVADDKLTSRLYFSGSGLKQLVDQVRDSHTALQTAQRRLVLARNSGGVEFATLADIFDHASDVIHRLHDLQSGLRYVPATELEDIARLRSFRVGLRDLSEKISAEYATQLMLLYQRRHDIPEFSSGWQVSWQQVQQQLIELQALHKLQKTEALLLESLDAVTQRWLLSRSEQSIAAPTAEQLQQNEASIRTELRAVMQDVNAMIYARAAASRAHGLRRLVIDTLLIIAAVWIVFASMRLVLKIRHQAYHDRLTNLPNRFRFDQFLNEATLSCRANGGTLSVAVMDVDNFKLVNNSLGHTLGDQLLIELGRRFLDAIDSRGKLARLGADEFALVALDRDGPPVCT